MEKLDEHLTVLTREVDRSSNRMAYAFLIVGAAITVALTYDRTGVAGIPTVSFALLIIAAVLLVMLIASIMREKYRY